MTQGQGSLFSSASAPKYDAFRNKLSDIGTSSDPHTHAEVAKGTRLSKHELDELYETGRFARKIVEKPPKDATRPEIRVVGTDNKRVFKREFRRHRVERKLREAMINARQTGGGAIVLMVDDGRDLDKPINFDQVSSVEAMHVFDRWDLSADEYHTDLRHKRYRKPRLYHFHPNQRGTSRDDPSKIHSDRVIRFTGARVRPFRRSYYNGWNQPVLETVFETMKDLGMCSEAIASAAEEFQYGVIRLANLHKLLVERDNGRQLMRERLMAIEESKSITNAVALDATQEEEMENVSAHIEQARQAYSVLQQNFSYAANMPISMLFGQMAQGLQVPDESGRQNYFDGVEDTREHEMTPALLRIVMLFSMAAGQFNDPDEAKASFEVQYGPLDELTAPSAADVFAQRADGHQKLVDAGVETSEEAQNRLFDDDISRRVPEAMARFDKFSGLDDEKLPDRIQNAPKQKAERWIAIFNEVFEETQNEARAFRAANSEVDIG